MGKIDVILRENVRGSGKKGQIVSVAEGYARNCLVPKGLAVIADEQAKSELAAQKEADAYRVQEELKEAERVKGIIDGQSVDVLAKAGKNGKLFGSVTVKDVAEALNKKFSLSIDKRKIKLANQDIKSVDSFGTFVYVVRIHSGVDAEIKVNVREITE